MSSSPTTQPSAVHDLGRRIWNSGAKRGLERLLRVILRVAVQEVPRPDAPTAEEIIERTEDLNVAAERYYVDYRDREFLLAKPYSDPAHFAQYLFNLGALFHGLKVSPEDVVLELGAGSCWVSHFLNLFGCRTISVDVSSSALELGRELFERDARTRWDLEPRFLPYDGHTLPLADESCDRVVIHDAFHHVPNPDAILRELARVLRPGGIIAMCEPGRGHSATEDSQREMTETGVLERDIELDELADSAEAAGFSHVSLLPLSLAGVPEVPARELMAFARGQGFFDFWGNWVRHLMTHYYLLLYKGAYVPTTRRPGRLDAHIELLGDAAGAPTRLSAHPGEIVTVECRITNRGDTRWLTGEGGMFGWTRLGIHLYRGEEDKALEYDWHRIELPREVEPGATVELPAAFVAPATPGLYRLVLDLVAEQVIWFAQKGSQPVEIRLTVENDAPRRQS
ncbi:MAG: methyltransferase domain-containing protein [Acidobacteria bacterium]|nr:methyltransferase domain-containing protein [Acidobacteriota bacterium]